VVGPLREYDLDGGRCQVRDGHDEHHAASGARAILTRDDADVLPWSMTGRNEARLHTLPSASVALAAGFEDQPPI